MTDSMFSFLVTAIIGVSLGAFYSSMMITSVRNLVKASMGKPKRSISISFFIHFLLRYASLATILIVLFAFFKVNSLVLATALAGSFFVSFYLKKEVSW